MAIVKRMGKTYVLDRVANDLARGLTHPAIQRLSSLVAAYPTDLDLRRRLAAAYRRVGNQIQAGRWDYLTIGADTTDTSAFERAFPSAAARLRAIRWPYRAAAAPTSYARSRLAKLVAAAEAEAPRETEAPREAEAPRETAPAGAGSAVPAWWQADPAGHRVAVTTRGAGRPAGLARLTRPTGLARLRGFLPAAAARPANWVLLTTGALGTVLLVAVGAVTVIEWIIH